MAWVFIPTIVTIPGERCQAFSRQLPGPGAGKLPGHTEERAKQDMEEGQRRRWWM